MFTYRSLASEYSTQLWSIESAFNGVNIYGRLHPGALLLLDDRGLVVSRSLVVIQGGSEELYRSLGYKHCTATLSYRQQYTNITNVSLGRGKATHKRYQHVVKYDNI